jgi:Putative Actinobacterial Holin-X, holin superfamily III
LPAENGKPETLGTTVTEVSERMSLLVREELELARAEVVVKARSLAAGAAAIAAGAVFGIFGVIFGLLTAAWGINSAINSLWIGFAIVFVLLMLMALAAATFAWRKLRVGPPTPNMAIDEAKKIRETVSTGPEGAA